MRRGAQPFLLTLAISAPIMDSGSMMRFMGRFWMDASPVRVTSKFWAARMPEIRRMVVPLLPQSSSPAGRFSPRMPFPCTSTRSPRLSMPTPIRRKQAMVERQSAPWRKPRISVNPLAMEPNMTARCEMDLSPGTASSPFNPDIALVNSIDSIFNSPS